MEKSTIDQMELVIRELLIRAQEAVTPEAVLTYCQSVESLVRAKSVAQNINYMSWQATPSEHMVLKEEQDCETETVGG